MNEDQIICKIVKNKLVFLDKILGIFGYLTILSFLIFIVCHYLFKIVNFNYFGYITAFILGIYVILTIIQFSPISFEKYGELILENDRIIIKMNQAEEIYRISNLKALEIGLYGYKGEFKFDISNIYYSNGAKNYIKIKDLKLNFLLENEEDAFSFATMITDLLKIYPQIKLLKSKLPT